jgi:FAD/FMN-containing dehydrogenase
MSRTAPPADDTATEEFRQAVRGDVLSEGDPVYDEARSVWNAMIDRKPALIVRATGAADVMYAVDYARENDLLLSVKGGGHNIAGSAVCEGGLMLDCSGMTDVRVDPVARIARVGPGATLGDVDHETGAFGLAAPGGVVSTTGVAGLTLGGGFGWLSRKYGLAVDNLRSVDVVTAAGELVHASEAENPELFWGIRGGGGNFGIVTSFEFDLHEVGEVLFGPVVYRYEDAPDVFRHYREFVHEGPRECCVWVDSLTAPPLPFLPEEYHGTKVLSVAAFYAGDPEEGERVLAPLRGYGDPVADGVAPTPYPAVQRVLDDLYGPGMRNYWTSQNFTELSDGVIDTVVEFAGRLPTPHSDILLHQVGGAINDVAPDATAYPHRDVEFVLTPGARWEDPAQDEACVAWIREIRETLAEHATGGVYVNFVSEGEERERAAYGENYDRLVELKNEWDPENLFRANQNVAPTV